MKRLYENFYLFWEVLHEAHYRISLLFEALGFLANRDMFDAGSFPYSWPRYLFCRVVGHAPEPYISGCGNKCAECNRCGRREVLEYV